MKPVLTASKQRSLQVVVRVRPLNNRDIGRSRHDIVRVLDDKTVIVLDPDLDKQYLDKIQHRTKEKHFSFDRAFDGVSSNLEIYAYTVQPLIKGLTEGLNATVFAYGATGSGKTWSMVGNDEDPGLMVLGFNDIFNFVNGMQVSTDESVDISCSYLEIYNEIIYDLLVESSGSLELREDPGQGVSVAGLKRVKVQSAGKILDLLRQGNLRRKTESTDANLTSSRSHAVLQIDVKRVVSSHSAERVMGAKLCLVDLAGSERASETNNMGQQLRDGANINKSLLALSNCINALCQQQKRGVGYVPYRNSKLTRLLKDGLSGNSRTTMVATICPAADQYHHIINTLKYADRAKEIKTRLRTNVRTVDSQSADYLKMIEKLQEEVSMLKGQLAGQAVSSSSMNSVCGPAGTSWLDDISGQLNENVQERINMQKAMCELNDCLKRAADELGRLDQKIAIIQNEDAFTKLEGLHHRRTAVLESIRDNEKLKREYAEDISKNEAERELLQQRLDSFVSNNEKSSFLHILHQFRFLSVAMTEVQFQLALRDQLIEEKSSALNSLWMLLQASDVDIEELLDVAVQKGVPLDSSLSSYIDMKLKEAITTPNGSPRFAQSVIRAATRTVHSRLNRANTDPAGSLSRPDMSFGSDDTGEVADCPDEREEELHLHAGNVPANQEATDRGTPDQVEDVVSQLPELNAGGSVAAIICEAMSAGMLSTPKAVGCLNSDADLIAEAEAFAYPSGNTVLQGSPDSPSSKARAKDDAHASTYSPKTSSPRKRWQGQSSMSSSPNSPARRAGLPATGPRRPVPKERKISTYHKKCFCSHHEKDEVKT